MPSAHKFAEGDGPIPREVKLLSQINRFGGQAIYGRAIGAGELKGMLLAEMVVNAYQAREKSGEWAKWAGENPDLNRLLIMAVTDGA